MAEYIERDEAIKAVMSAKWERGSDGAMAMEIVAGAPSADVRPERHGRWSDNMVSYMDDFNGDMHIGFQCSECKAILNKTKYCGNCGVKMDGKEKL